MSLSNERYPPLHHNNFESLSNLHELPMNFSDNAYCSNFHQCRWFFLVEHWVRCPTCGWSDQFIAIEHHCCVFFIMNIILIRFSVLSCWVHTHLTTVSCHIFHFFFLLQQPTELKVKKVERNAFGIYLKLNFLKLEVRSPKCSSVRYSTIIMPNRNRCSKFEFQKLQPTVLWRRLIPSPIFLSPSQSNKNIMMSSFSTELHNNPRCSTWHSSVSWC